MSLEKPVPLLQALDHGEWVADDVPPVLAVPGGPRHGRRSRAAHPSLRVTAGRAWTITRGILRDLAHDDTGYLVDRFPEYRAANLEIHRIQDTIHRFDR